MPVITVRTVEGISAEKKEELMARMTDVMKDVLGKILKQHILLLKRFRLKTGA